MGRRTEQQGNHPAGGLGGEDCHPGEDPTPAHRTGPEKPKPTHTTTPNALAMKTSGHPAMAPLELHPGIGKDTFETPQLSQHWGRAMETGVDEKKESAPAPAGPLTQKNLNSLLLRFLNSLKRAGKSTHTLSAYSNDLGLFTTFLLESGHAPDDWFGKLVDDWEAYLQGHGRHSAASVRRALMSVRTFCHFLIKEKIIDTSPFLEPKSPKQPRHDLLTASSTHFQNLVTFLKRRACLGDEKAVRDLAILLVLGDTGLKASEAANLTWSDVHLAPEAPGKRASGSLLVRGGNERVVPFGPDLAFALEELRKVRRHLELPAEAGAKLFFGYLNLTRKTRTASLHRHGIKFVVYEVCTELLGVPYNSESLRNRAILHWLNQGLSLQQVADLAGYSSLNSLERFSLESRGMRLPKRKTREKKPGDE